MTPPPLRAQPITAEAFAPYGELVEPGAVEPLLINAGQCRRYTDLARLEAEDGRIGVSLFDARLRPLPLRVDLLERHPLGSQCFCPLDGSEYIVVVAPDAGGAPGAPRAFLAGPRQPVNIARNVWHGVLAPVAGSGLFLVIDRIGPGANLEEHRLDPPLQVAAP
jgi:ureidoglycolate lyase